MPEISEKLHLKVKNIVWVTVGERGARVSLCIVKEHYLH
jgi:hypothetical protein